MPDSSVMRVYRVAWRLSVQVGRTVIHSGVRCIIQQSVFTSSININNASKRSFFYNLSVIYLFLISFFGKNYHSFVVSNNNYSYSFLLNLIDRQSDKVFRILNFHFDFLVSSVVHRFPNLKKIKILASRLYSSSRQQNFHISDLYFRGCCHDCHR